MPYPNTRDAFLVIWGAAYLYCIQFIQNNYQSELLGTQILLLLAMVLIVSSTFVFICWAEDLISKNWTKP